MRIQKAAVVVAVVLCCGLLALADSKPKLTLDEFFNSVSFSAIELSPDGNSVVIGTERADWDQQIFRSDLWLYRDDAKGGSLIQLTQSGHDSSPKWSPDGHWIAFLSERKTSAEKASSDEDKDEDKKDEGVNQIYLISPAGGEAFAVTQGEEEVHTFSWSADSHTLYFATRNPWTKTQKDDYKKEWKDVLQYRTAERGDTIFALDLATAIARHAVQAAKEESESEKESDLTPGARAIAKSPLRVEDLVTSPDGSKLSFVTSAVNQRQEKYEDIEIYALSVARALLPAKAEGSSEAALPEPHRLTHNQAAEGKLHWANDNRHVFFSVEVGDVAGPYRDLQPHLYWVDSEKPDSEKPDSDSGSIEQWSKDFIGPVEHYAVTNENILTSARRGTEVQMSSVTKPAESLHHLSNWTGTYEGISASAHSPRVAFVYTSLGKPAEVYLADSTAKLDQARAITSFNKLFTERDLPQAKPSNWKAAEATTVQLMFIFSPSTLNAQQ